MLILLVLAVDCCRPARTNQLSEMMMLTSLIVGDLSGPDFMSRMSSLKMFSSLKSFGLTSSC